MVSWYHGMKDYHNHMIF